MQMIVTIAIIAVVSVFGVLGITNARAEFRLQNSARLFATYVEKARADAIRRHAPAGQESWIETFGPGTSNTRVPWILVPALQTRTFQLETGLAFPRRPESDIRLARQNCQSLGVPDIQFLSPAKHAC